MRTFLTVLSIICAGVPVYAQIDRIQQADSLLTELHRGGTSSLDTALFQSEELIEYYGTIGAYCRQIKSLLHKSGFYTSASEFKKALRCLQEADSMYLESSCDADIHVLYLLKSSNLHIGLEEFDVADSLALQAIELYKKQSWNKDTVTLIKLYMNLGKGNRGLDQVLPYLDTAYHLANRYQKSQLEQKVLIDIGSSYAMNDSIELANDYLKKALLLARKRDRPKDMMVLYNNLAGLSDDEDEILQYIDSAMHFAILTDNIQAQQVFIQNKAYFLSLTGQFEKGYQTLWQAFILKDSILSVEKYKTIAEMQEKYEAEKKSNEIKTLKLENLNTEVEKLRYKRNQNRLFIGSGILFFVALFLGYSFVIIRKNKNTLAEKNREISKAREQSDALLLNILPEEVARELKAKGRADAQQYDRVSILFTDFVHFTQKVETLATEELLEELNYCFKGFDRIVEQYGIEKIKTIGDSYMAVGGIPVPMAESVKNTILAALEMQSFLEDRKKQQEALGQTYFEMRAGINTGAVVAGIVGDKKFQYDIWGDAVNTASRMESHGSPGKVNISNATYELIRQDPDFTFKLRGLVEAKGKGKVRMYFVATAKNQ